MATQEPDQLECLFSNEGEIEIMKTLDALEIIAVSGGDRWGAERRDGTACANTIMAWGGMGSTIGGALGSALAGSFGGIIGSFGGLAGGGFLATRFSQNCAV